MADIPQPFDDSDAAMADIPPPPADEVTADDKVTDESSEDEVTDESSEDVDDGTSVATEDLTRFHAEDPDNEDVIEAIAYKQYRQEKRELRAAQAEEEDWDKDAESVDTEALILQSMLTERTIDLPAFAEEAADGEGTIVIKLADMDHDTHVRVASVMAMYTEKPSYFDRITNPITLAAEMTLQDKFKVAFVVSATEISEWDWTTDLPDPSKVNYDQACVMKGLYNAVKDKRTEITAKVRLPQLKGWRHYTRLWQEGRRLYSNYQYLMPGSSPEAIEEAIISEVGKMHTRPQLELFVAKKHEDFKQDKMKEQRAREIQAGTTTGVVMGSQVTPEDLAATTGKPAATPAVIPPGPRSSMRLRAKEAAATIPRINRMASLPLTSGASKSAYSRRSSAPSGMGAESKKRAPLPSFDGTAARRPRLACGMTDADSTVAGPPKLVEDVAKGLLGYTDPTEEWTKGVQRKLTLVQNLINLCADEGIAGPRAELDTAIDEIMGGGANYDKPFILLLTFSISDNMEKGDEDLLKILKALKEKNLLTPQAIVETGAVNFKKAISPFDNSIRAAWITKMCNALVVGHEGKVPTKPTELLALGVPEISVAVANAVCQESFGHYYGPSVDHHYGVRMAVALDLVDVGQFHFDKFEINFNQPEMPAFVRESLLTWMLPRHWKGFHKLMVSMAQMVAEPKTKETLENIKKIIKKNFLQKESVMLLGMVEQIRRCFGLPAEEPKK